MVFPRGHEPGVPCRLYVAMILWMLGYQRKPWPVSTGLAWPRELSHPFSLALTVLAATASQFRRDVPAEHEQAEAAVALATEHGIPQWRLCTSIRGWALALQGQGGGAGADPPGNRRLAGHRGSGCSSPTFYLLADVSAHRAT